MTRLLFAAALVGGLLSYLFAEPLPRKTAARRPRAKARAVRRTRARGARAAA
jgi:hypothetical protein